MIVKPDHTAKDIASRYTTYNAESLARAIEQYASHRVQEAQIIEVIKQSIPYEVAAESGDKYAVWVEGKITTVKTGIHLGNLLKIVNPEAEIVIVPVGANHKIGQ